MHSFPAKKKPQVHRRPQPPRRHPPPPATPPLDSPGPAGAPPQPRKAKSGQGGGPTAPTPRSGEPSACGPGEKRGHRTRRRRRRRRRRCGASGCQEFSSPSLLFSRPRAINAPLVWLFFSQLVSFSIHPFSPVASPPSRGLASAIKTAACGAGHARLRPLPRPALRRPKGRAPLSAAPPAAPFWNSRPLFSSPSPCHWRQELAFLAQEQVRVLSSRRLCLFLDC